MTFLMFLFVLTAVAGLFLFRSGHAAGKILTIVGSSGAILFAILRFALPGDPDTVDWKGAYGRLQEEAGRLAGEAVLRDFPNADVMILLPATDDGENLNDLQRTRLNALEQALEPLPSVRRVALPYDASAAERYPDIVAYQYLMSAEELRGILETTAPNADLVLLLGFFEEALRNPAALRGGPALAALDIDAETAGYALEIGALDLAVVLEPFQDDMEKLSPSEVEDRVVGMVRVLSR